MDHGAHDHHHDPGAHGGPRETELFRLESQVEHGRGADRPEPPQVQPVGPAQVQRSFEQEQHGESTEQEHGESECDRRPPELAPDGPGEGGAQQHEHRQDGEPIDRLVDLDLRCTLAAGAGQVEGEPRDERREHAVEMEHPGESQYEQCEQDGEEQHRAAGCRPVCLPSAQCATAEPAGEHTESDSAQYLPESVRSCLSSTHRSNKRDRGQHERQCQSVVGA